MKQTRKRKAAKEALQSFEVRMRVTSEGSIFVDARDKDHAKEVAEKTFDKLDYSEVVDWEVVGTPKIIE